MTIAFSTYELTSLQASQESYMSDLCNILTISGTVDTTGDYIKSWVTTSGVKCGLEQTSSAERYGQISVLILMYIKASS